MRSALMIAAMLCAFSARSVLAFSPDELNRITFENSTGSRIELLFLSPGDSSFWGPDIIGADYVLNDRCSVSYYVHYPAKSFTFDLEGMPVVDAQLETACR